MRASVVRAVVVVLIAGCDPPPHILLTVEDPHGLGAEAVDVAVGMSPSRLHPHSLDGATFPLRMTAWADTAGFHELWVEARAAGERPLGRGVVRAQLRKSRTGSATIQLGAHCETLATDGDGEPCILPDAAWGQCVRGVCQDPVCGDGVEDPVREECDDGNRSNDDHCLDAGDTPETTCRVNTCGDGYRDPAAEACDDGDNINGGTCSADCQNEIRCGDREVDFGEACDDGNQNPNDACDACRAVAWAPTVIAGLGPGDARPLDIALGNPTVIDSDRAGNLTFFQLQTVTLMRYDVNTQRVTPLLERGNFTLEAGARSGAALELAGVGGLAVDELGNVYVSDINTNRILRVQAESTAVDVIAGTGDPGSAGDGGPAIAAQLNGPTAVTVDGGGNLYVVDALNHLVRRIDNDGNIDTFAGGGGGACGPCPAFCGEMGPAKEACLDTPKDVAVGPDGAVYIADSSNYRVRRVDAAGNIETVLGSGAPDPEPGPPLSSGLGTVREITVDGAGNIFLIGTRVTDAIRWYDATNNRLESLSCQSVGDPADGPAINSPCREPWGVAVDAAGRVYFTDNFNHRVRRLVRVGSTWMVSTFIGTGEPVTGLATKDLSELLPYVLRLGPGMATLETGPPQRIYAADGANSQVLAVDPNLRRLAGNGRYGLWAEGAQAVATQLKNPRAVAADPMGRIFVADRDAHRVAMIATDGTITTVAGNGICGFSEGLAIDAQLDSPSGLAVDSDGNLLIADTFNHRIRKLDFADDMLSTVVGTGDVTFNEAVGLAPDQTNLNQPMSLLRADLDVLIPGSTGDLILFADRGNHRARAYTKGVLAGMQALDQVITLAGNGDVGLATGSGNPLDLPLEYPRGVMPFVDLSCDLVCLLVADGIDRVHMVEMTLAGDTMSLLLGGPGAEEDGPFSQALLRGPSALLPLASGAWLVADRGSGHLRSVDFDAGWVATVGGFPEGDDVDSLRWARRLQEPHSLVYDPDVQPPVVYLTERAGHVIRKLTLVDPADPATWRIEDFAGQLGNADHADGLLSAARFDGPAGLAWDAASRTLYVAEVGNHTVRAIGVDGGAVTTVLGIPGSLGQGPGLLHGPEAVVTQADELYVADTKNHRVIRTRGGQLTMERVIGTGSAGSGSGDVAGNTAVSSPAGLAFDLHGNLIVSSGHTVVLLALDAAGEVSAGSEVFPLYGSEPRATFPEPVTHCLGGISLDGADRVLVLDRCLGLMIALDRTLSVPP